MVLTALKKSHLKIQPHVLSGNDVSHYSACIIHSPHCHPHTLLTNVTVPPERVHSVYVLLTVLWIYACCEHHQHNAVYMNEPHDCTGLHVPPLEMIWYHLNMSVLKEIEYAACHRDLIGVFHKMF